MGGLDGKPVELRLRERIDRLSVIVDEERTHSKALLAENRRLRKIGEQNGHTRRCGFCGCPVCECGLEGYAA